MRKPPSLRTHLTAALPQYRQSPENLLMFVTGGHVSVTGTSALGWQWEYSLRIVLCDFIGHPDAVIGPTLIWLRAHQPDVLNNPSRQKKAIQIQADYLNESALDLVLDVQLSESVHARPIANADGAFELLHRLEPPCFDQQPHDEVTALYLNGEQLAAWPPVEVKGN